MARKTMVELLAEISANFPNNTTQLISPAKLREFCTDFVDSVTVSYGILSSPSLVQVVGSSDQLLPWVSTYLVQSPEFTTNPATGTIRRDQNIVVNEINVNIDLAMAANRECIMSLYANGVPTIWRAKAVGNGTTRPETISLVAVNYSAVPVNYQLFIQADAPGTSITFSNGVFAINSVPVRQAL